jgi:hypothetical protein
MHSGRQTFATTGWSFALAKIYGILGTMRFTKTPMRNWKSRRVSTKMVVVPDNKPNKTDDSKRFPTIQGPRPAILYDSQRFKTQGQRFYMIRYDSRPKASNSIASNNSMRFKSHAQTFYPIQQWWYSNSCKLWACRWLDDQLESSRAQAQGLLVGGGFCPNPRDTSNYLYNPRYDYDNERIK